MKNLRPEHPKKIIHPVESGGPETSANLLPLLYGEIRNLAHNLLTRYPTSENQQATSLVHEAYLRLGTPDDPDWNGCGHFFAAINQAMRRVLVEKARWRKAVKHGGEMKRIELVSDAVGIPPVNFDFLALDEALEELKVTDGRKVNVVILRFFNGLTIKETAAVLNVSESTVVRDWKFSRAFLLARLDEEGG